jgi:hypothetical protein
MQQPTNRPSHHHHHHQQQQRNLSSSQVHHGIMIQTLYNNMWFGMQIPVRVQPSNWTALGKYRLLISIVGVFGGSECALVLSLHGYYDGPTAGAKTR